MDVAIDADGADAGPGEAKTGFPSIWVSFGWIMLYFVLQIFITGILIAASADPAELVSAAGKPSEPASLIKNPALIMWGLVAAGFIQITLMWLYLRPGDRAQQLGLTHFGRMPLWRTLGLAAVVVTAAFAFNFFYSAYLIPGIGMQDEMMKLLASIPRTTVNIVVGFTAIAVIAPLVEELLFRGFLQNALARKMPIWAAITLSAFLFSLVHMQLYAIPALMSLGAAFGYLYHRTGSLRTNIILHMANNGVALILTQGLPS